MSRTPTAAAADGIQVRALKGLDELVAAAALFRTAMVGLPLSLPFDAKAVAELYEPGRAYGAFQDGELIGTTDSYSGTLTAPGGAELSQAAVTHVGVLPTHTRRGAATALLRTQLVEARARGEIVASLRASDARIYERFGYGVASLSATFELEKEAAALRPQTQAEAEVRLVDVDAAWPLLAEIYARQPSRRAGAISRSRYWWRLQRLRRAGAQGPAYVAVSGAKGQESGYVRYHPTGLDAWFSSARRTIVVDDLVATNPQAYKALLRYLLNIDLAHVLVFADRPLDDPLAEMLVNRRAVRVVDVRDETWLRILDVRAALAARSFAGRSEVTLEIVDNLLPENNARFQITSEGATETSAHAEVTADVSTLAAAYLGGAKWWQLAQAGRASESQAGAIAALDGLFATPLCPHAGTVF